MQRIEFLYLFQANSVEKITFSTYNLISYNIFINVFLKLIEYKCGYIFRKYIRYRPHIGADAGKVVSFIIFPLSLSLKVRLKSSSSFLVI